MPAHHRVKAWIANNYQKPAIDQEWLADCSDWLANELGLDPATDFDQFIHHVEAQLLQSNLADSTVHGSGIDPILVAGRQKQSTGTTPLLVEIIGITEIAHSAFNLLNTHQTRLDRADLGLARDDNAEQQPDEDEGPIPKFPRGMLRFELSDGLTTFRAIEFGSLPQLELGTTPLGYKLFLKSTPIRNGIAFLEPGNVILKGYRNEDHDANREQVFLSSLRKRLGRPDPPPEPVAAQPQPEAAPAPVQPAHQHQPPPPRPPSPPTDLDDMYVDDDVDPDVLREMAIQMDEDIPAPPPARHPPSKERPAATSNSRQALRIETRVASSSLEAPSTIKTSSYFTAQSSESENIPDIGLSPRPAPRQDLAEFDADDSESSKVPVKRPGAMSSRPPKPSSPDPFDDLSFDMDVDEAFLEQVGEIEQGALGTGSNRMGKGKGRDTTTEGRPSAAPAKKTLSDLAPRGTKRLAASPISPCSAEPNTRMQSSSKRATSSLSRSTESPMPRSTQSSDRHLPRDPSLIILSSSEEEIPKSRSTAKHLNRVRRHVKKESKADQMGVPDSEVIDISD